MGELSLLITKGTTPKRYESSGVNFIKTESFENNQINKNKLSFISKETHCGELQRSVLEENDILITIAGATIGKCVVVSKELIPANTNQALAIIRLNDKNNVNYIFHLLRSIHMKKYILNCVKGSAQPNLNLKQLSEFKVPMIKYSEQECIVSILDKFDALVNDISEGLPAELNARRKQYEYYRDKLLTFSEK